MENDSKTVLFSFSSHFEQSCSCLHTCNHLKEGGWMINFNADLRGLGYNPISSPRQENIQRLPLSLSRMTVKRRFEFRPSPTSLTNEKKVARVLSRVLHRAWRMQLSCPETGSMSVYRMQILITYLGREITGTHTCNSSSPV